MSITVSKQKDHMNYHLKNQNVIVEQQENSGSLLAESVVGMAAVDWSSGEILVANPILCDILQVKREEIEGGHIRDIIGRNFYIEYRRKLLAAKKMGQDNPFIIEFHWEKEDRWLQITARVLTWPDSRMAVAAAVIDISLLRKCKDEYKDLALYDGKLNLPNGVKLEQDLADKPSFDGVSLICMDVHNLKAINDIYGWDAGDSLLFQLRDWLLEQKVPNSGLYRIEADEFGILMEHTEPDEVDKIAKHIRLRFNRAWDFHSAGQSPLPFYCAITIAVIHGNQMFGSRDMTSLADRILRNPHIQGKVTIYDARIDVEYKKSIIMQQKIAACVQNHMEGFAVHYQPLVDPCTGVWRGVEALCRWTCSELGKVSPSVFIPEAERLGLIGKIGLWVLETAVSHCKQWGLDKHDSFLLDVNISPIQLRDEHLSDNVLKILDRHGYPGSRLSLEITESMEFNFDNHSLDALSKLIQAGVAVALDDFGTGYSSFHSLKHLPAAILKTEKSFIHNIEKDYYTQQLFRVMVELAHVADKKLIAEGVETNAQMELLISHKVDLLQGYLFSRPLPAAELAKKLEHFYKQS